MITELKMYMFKKRNNKKVRFDRNTICDTKCIFEGNNIICRDTQIYNVKLGFASYVSYDCNLSNCAIGKYTSIGPHVNVIIGTHPVNRYISTHPAFFSMRKQVGFTFVTEQLFEEIKYIDDEKKYSVDIGSDVWIGAGVSILQGVKIGDGAIIAAGAVVNADVPAYAIVGGVPAKLIRHRFSMEDIQFLKSLKWWEKDVNWLKEHAQYFVDVELLKNHLGLKGVGEL